MKERLDVLLVKRNLAESREKAESNYHVRQCIWLMENVKIKQERHFRMMYRLRLRDTHFHM